MNILTLSKTFGRGIATFSAAHARELFAIGATVGVVAVAITTPDAKIKAEEVIKKAKQDLKDTSTEDTATKRIIAKETAIGVTKATWKAVLAAGTTIGCIWGFYRFDMKKIAALTSLCALSSRQIEDLLEFKKKATDILGEEKTKEINHEVVEERMKKNPGSIMPLPGEPTTGMDIWYDEFSDRYFYSSMAIIEKAVNKLNADIATDNQPYVELDDFYDEIGLYNSNERTQYAREMGWSNFCKSDRIELIFDTFHSDVYGKAVNSFCFSTRPDTAFKNYRSVLG